jgi:hypothetical protein
MISGLLRTSYRQNRQLCTALHPASLSTLGFNLKKPLKYHTSKTLRLAFALPKISFEVQFLPRFLKRHRQ